MTKYHNRKVKADGYTFDSLAEYARYRELRLLETAGVITALEVHPTYLLQPGFRYHRKAERAINYEADFQYVDLETGARIVEDVKGKKTEGYKLKRKLFLAKYGDDYDFREIAA
jgi:hypothetical protein